MTIAPLTHIYSLPSLPAPRWRKPPILPPLAAKPPPPFRRSAVPFLFGLAAGLLLAYAAQPDGNGARFYRRALARSSQSTADALRLAEERRQDGRKET